MISKRHLYGPIDRIDSAINQLRKAAANGPVPPGLIEEIVARDLVDAKELLDYAYEML